MWELTRQLPLWGYIYGYAVLYSAAVDAALRKLKIGQVRMALTVLLYVLGGYFPFMIWFPNQWMLSLIAGLYGVACALSFLAASHLFRGCLPFSAPAALLLLAGAIYSTLSDFTVTEQWMETRTAESYRAEFNYFDGRKEIPIKLTKGLTLSYYIDWQITNGCGCGTHLDAARGEYRTVKKNSEGWISYRAEASSIVRIVVTAERAQGGIHDQAGDHREIIRPACAGNCRAVGCRASRLHRIGHIRCRLQPPPCRPI